jgi:hypothetical protein
MIWMSPVLMLILVAAFVFVLATTTSQLRRDSQRRAGGRTCQFCGVPHPPAARYCRRCGKAL